METVCAINNPDSTSIPGYVYYRDKCVMTSTPNFVVYAHRVTLSSGASVSFAYTTSLTQCVFSVSLSGGTEVEPSISTDIKTLPLLATIKDQHGQSYTLSLLGVLVLLLPLTSKAILPGEGIMLDPNTGDYIISYANAVGRLKQSRFVPSTKIDPSLRSKLKTVHGMIQYSFTVRNGVRAKQPLIGLTFDPVSSVLSDAKLPASQQEFLQTVQQMQNDTARLQQYVVDANSVVMAPQGWSCEVMPNGQAVRTTFRVACGFDDLDEHKHNGLRPGNLVSGFRFFSLDLPGVGLAQLRGFGDMGPGFADEGPDGDISDQLDKLMENDYVPHITAVPTIAVPVPFDASVLLNRIRAHVATWPGKRLVDPAFASHLDRYLAAAADAYRLDNAKAGKDHIETLRKMLAKEHHNVDHDDEDNDDAEERKTATRFSIDRLAARVLDFDLRYVLKRMEREHEESAGNRERPR
jgi:hypothetical protein